jgi:2',3'-cyclic-nucleotide 2'-phosphodiesterase (5'-nucleotidase family)
MRALSLILALWALCSAPARGADFTVRFTASLNGSLEGCDCKLTPRAGLVKLAAWLRTVHRPGTDLLVDAGDLFPEGDDPLLDRYLLESYAELGYAAVAVGERELEAGAGALLAYGRRFPLICNNLTLRDSRGQWIAFSPAPTVVDLSGRKVAILSLLDPEAASGLAPALRAAFRLEPPRDVATRLLRDPSVSEADLVLLLFHGSEARAAELLRGLERVDVAILAHDQKLIAPHLVEGAVVASPGEAGNRVGELTVSRRAIPPAFGGTFRSFNGGFGPDDPAVRRRADEYDAELRSRLSPP